MGSAGRSKKTGSGGKGSSALHKRGVRKKFRARHLDQVWEDVRKPTGVVTNTHGPIGTMLGELDEDVPGRGKVYCTPCSRYCVNETAQADHERTKPHKRRVKELLGAKPHTQEDADWAGGMGPKDNGKG